MHYVTFHLLGIMASYTVTFSPPYVSVQQNINAPEKLAKCHRLTIYPFVIMTSLTLWRKNP
jgi:hypothetical protein